MENMKQLDRRSNRELKPEIKKTSHNSLDASNLEDSIENEIKNELLLAFTAGIGPRIYCRLLNYFTTANSVLSASRQELMEVPGIGYQLANAIHTARERVPLQQILNWCRRNNCEILHAQSPHYPRLLREIDDAPRVLFAQGQIDKVNHPSVAMVGTRHPTLYGREQAKRFSRELSEMGINVVSGLARGIDQVSHQSCLETDGSTIAVLGSGLGRVYPPEHHSISREIIKSGIILSEYPPLQRPNRSTFPRRNRIISGLCVATLVVEAPRKSGALITAKLALEQNREVMAIPGPISNPNSEGCHDLIRDGAKLIKCVGDILEELPSSVFTLPDSKQTQPHPPPTQGLCGNQNIAARVKLNTTERKIIDSIAPDGTHVDSIIHRTQLEAKEVMATVNLLELRGLITKSNHHKIYPQSIH